MSNRNYYEVVCKGGHVGHYQFMRINLYVVAATAKEAAAKARNCPRVKHDQKDCILGVTRITMEDYQTGYARNSEDPYFKATNIQEQRAYGGIYERTEPDESCSWKSYERLPKCERKTLRERNLKKYQKMIGLYA